MIKLLSLVRNRRKPRSRGGAGSSKTRRRRENGKRRVVVTANVRGRDIGSLVDEAAYLVGSFRLAAGDRRRRATLARARQRNRQVLQCLDVGAQVTGIIETGNTSWRFKNRS